MSDRTGEGNLDRAGPRPVRAIDRQVLLRFARQTIEEYLRDGERPPVPTGSGALLFPRASFVTLRTRGTGALRGCVGETAARGPLIESVGKMAVAAATEDPRFPPVTLDEVPQLHIEISALTPMVPILPDQVEVGRHGLMIRWKGHVGLLLPQVPVSQGWSRSEFLSGLCRKANLPDDAWSAPDAELLGFECEVWEEEGESEGPDDR